MINTKRHAPNKQSLITLNRFLIFVLAFFCANLIFAFPVQAQENKFGINVAQYYSEKGFQDHNKWREHLDWAKNLVGPGGYVKLLFPWVGEADAPVSTYQSVVNEAYARDLNPIVRIQDGWATSNQNQEIGLTGCWKRPPQNSGTPYSFTSGQYSEYAQKVADFVDTLPPPPQGKTLFIELWNEMNYDFIEWCDDQGNSRQEPQNYARFYLEVFNRVQALGKPNIKVVNGGLGRGNPTGYLRQVLTELSTTVGQNPSTLQNLFEYYATHVYPQTSSDETFLSGAESYKQELAVLGEFGINQNQVKVLVTEGGYIRGAGDQSQEDARQARLSVELLKRIMADSQVAAVTLFSLDDHTDRTFYSIDSPLNTTLFVPTNASSVNGVPQNPRPVYTAVRNLRTGEVQDTSECTNCGADKPYPIGYAIAEDQAIVNSLNLPLVYTRDFPISIAYTFKNQTPGTKILFIKYFYSNGGSKVVYTTVKYKPQERQAQICTPGEGLALCKQTQCEIGKEYADPKTQVLGHTSASSCPAGQTFYSCSDIKCPDGSTPPGGGCYPDTYTTDCLSHCPTASTTVTPPTYSTPASTSSASVSTPTSAPAGSCADECFSDELRFNVGRDATGQCNSGVVSSSYYCRAGEVGARRVCGNIERLCVDGGQGGFYWTQLGAVQPPQGEASTSVSGYATTFTCNSQGTAWTCSNSSFTNSCR